VARVLAAAAWLVAPAVARAHAEHGGEVTAEMHAPPPALDGVTVTLHKTLTYQLVIENRTTKTLEVIGTSGRPFLRVGPRGVEADLASPEWYRTYTSIGAPIPAAARRERREPRWTKVSDTPAWGWFDLRLRSGKEPRGRWAIPLRIDGVRTRVSGTFRRVAPPSGSFAPRLLGASELGPGVELQLLRGEQPGLYLENRGATPVTILGAQGEPFLRVGPDGVLVNLASPSWLASGQAEASSTEARADARSPPRWQKRSPVPRFSWLEPRLGVARAAPPAAGRDLGRPVEVQRWEIGYLLGDERRTVAGVIDWFPAREP
jgi:hypothetical protein